MKKLSTLLTFLLISSSLFSQKYKDIFPSIAKASDEEALAIIKSYMIDDLDHPNSNIRLALIYEKRYKESDPITEYERAMANANEAKIRFTKSAAIVTEKEVSKNSGYYAEFSSGFDSKGRLMIEYSNVNQKIRNGYDSAKNFTEKLPAIYEYFTRSVDYHDRAIKLFNELNGQFNSRDKLLLMHNAAINFKLKDLISDYDSSIHNLDQYLAAGKAFDPEHFNQSYTVKNIDTYRLQGLLTSPNFLIENIEIWNYKKWAQEVMREVETDVSSLRTDLNAADLELTKALKPMSPLVSVADYNPYTLDSKLIFNLVKYDNGSLPVSLLKYKQKKQDLIYQLGAINDRDTTGSNEIFLANLGKLIYDAHESDSLLIISNNRVNEENFEKYESYFHTHYNGLPGIKQFIVDEKKLAKDAKQQAVSTMLNILNQSAIDNDQASAYISYKGMKIPKREEVIDLSTLDNLPHTLRTIKNADGSEYASGIIKKKEGLVVVYLVKVDGNGRVAWYKEYAFAEDAASEINILGDMTITPEGCGLMVRTEAGGNVMNTLHYVGENGETIFSNKIALFSYPRRMNYLESTNSFLMIYRGDAAKQVLNKKEETQILSVNILGDINWSQNFEYAGSFSDLLTLGKGFMIIGNYSEIRDVEGKTYRTKINNGQTNGFAARFSPTGKLASLTPIESSTSYHISNVIKVNDKVINLLGNRGSLDSPESKKIHIIVNSGPQILHSDL